MAKTLTADETKIIDLMQHIAEQDAEIAELERWQADARIRLDQAVKYGGDLLTEIAQLREQLEKLTESAAIDKAIIAGQYKEVDWKTPVLNALQADNNRLREQVARMPVCVAFTTEAGIKKLTSSTTERDTPISTKKSAVGSHLIPLYTYIDPPSTANQQPDAVAQEPPHA